jgi:hypothetical protein
LAKIGGKDEVVRDRSGCRPQGLNY